MSSNQGFWLKASASAPLTQGRRVENLCCLLWSARGGVKSSIQCGPNPHSLPDWTWELLRNVTLLSSQSCQRVYCMTILQEEIWCFVNFELCELCSCDRAQPSPSPRPRPTPNFLTQEWIRSPGPSHHLRYLTANSTCPLSLWNRSFQEWVLWRLCLIFIAPIRLFNALLLCSISLNIFMSRKKTTKKKLQVCFLYCDTSYTAS